jgi:hypothetical protein
MITLNDNPIRDRASDTLGRAESAEAFALHGASVPTARTRRCGRDGAVAAGDPLGREGVESDLARSG